MVPFYLSETKVQYVLKCSEFTSNTSKFQEQPEIRKNIYNNIQHSLKDTLVKSDRPKEKDSRHDYYSADRNFIGQNVD